MNISQIYEGLKEMVYSTSPVETIVSYPEAGMKLVKRKSIHQDICSHVIGFTKLDDSECLELLPFNVIYEKDTVKWISVFSNWCGKLPTLTIISRERHGSYGEMRIKIVHRELFKEVSKTYDLFRRKFSYQKKEDEKLPLFIHPMHIEWEQYSQETLQRVANSMSESVSWDSSEMRIVSELTLFLGRCGKDPCLVFWSGKSISFYSIKHRMSYHFEGELDYDD